MSKQAKSKSWYIQVIHIAKKQLQMDEDSYRANLVELAGKDSTKEMTTPELVTVLSFMEEHGFKLKPKKGASPKSSDKEVKTLLDKLRQQWIQMHRAEIVKDGSELALESWALNASARMNKGNRIQKLEWIKPWMLSQLIEQLKQWEKRVEDAA